MYVQATTKTYHNRTNSLYLLSPALTAAIKFINYCTVICEIVYLCDVRPMNIKKKKICTKTA